MNSETREERSFNVESLARSFIFIQFDQAIIFIHQFFKVQQIERRKQTKVETFQLGRFDQQQQAAAALEIELRNSKHFHSFYWLSFFIYRSMMMKMENVLQ